MTEYNKKVEFLKGLIETQKMVRQGSVFEILRCTSVVAFKWEK